MKKKDQYNRKNLQARLSAMMTIYMDGLGNKKKKRLEEYLDYKLKDVVDYYVKLLKKKDKKSWVLPPKINELAILSKHGHSVNETPQSVTLVDSSLTSEELKNVEDEINQEENELTENMQTEVYGKEFESSGRENISALKSELPPLNRVRDIAVKVFNFL